MFNKILTLIICALFIVVGIEIYVKWKTPVFTPRQQPLPSLMQPGMHFGLLDRTCSLPFRKRIVVYASAACKFCDKSASFYQKLLNVARASTEINSVFIGSRIGPGN